MRQREKEPEDRSSGPDEGHRVRARRGVWTEGGLLASAHVTHRPLWLERW